MEQTAARPERLDAPPRGLRARVREMVRLALPQIASRSGMLVMAVVDTAMVGRFAANELAYQSLGNAVTIPLFVTSLGLLLGTLVMTAKTLGSGRTEKLGAVWRRATVYAVVLGTICMVIAFTGEWVLVVTGQSEDLVRGGGEVVRVLALGLPFMMIYLASAYFLEGLKRPVAPMVFMIIANLFNVLFNWMWVYGNLGFDAMGAVGSSWATTSMRILLAAVIVAYVWNLHDREALAIRRKAEGGWRDWADQRRIGYSAGGSHLIESTAFAAQSFIAGLLGALALAAYSIAFQVLALIFMTAVGIGAASAVMVGHAWGRGDTAEMSRAGWTGLGLNTIAMSFFGVLVVAFSPHLAQGFAKDPALIELATPLIAFISLLLIFDGGQAVLSHVLRGRGETWFPVVAHTVSYGVILLPLAIVLALPMGRGVMGILEAILIASVVALCVLAWRFHRLAKRDQR